MHRPPRDAVRPRSRGSPTRPAPPRSSPTRVGSWRRRAPVGNGTFETRRGELRIDHRADQLLEAHRGFPSELRPRFGRIADEDRRVDRTEVPGILTNVRFPVQTDVAEG